MRTHSEFEDVFGCQPVNHTVGAKQLSVVAVMQNEALRLPYFLDFYRRLGVSTFFIIDDHSTDQTAEILRSAPDVVSVLAKGAFRKNKPRWVQAVCNQYCDGRWVLLLDADELVVYPGAPERSLIDLVSTMEAENEDGLYAPLIDMYSDGRLADVDYVSGEPFLDHCNKFDGDGYVFVSREIVGRKHLTPDHYIMGGARQRLLLASRQPNALERWLLQTYFSIDDVNSPAERPKILARAAWRCLKYGWLRARPAMSKVPLLRWRAGDEINGGYHSIARKLKLADEWGALLHFKYFQDFAAKNKKKSASGKYSGQYSNYQRSIEQEGLPMAPYQGTKTYTGVESLIAAGLVRVRKARNSD